MNPTFPVVRFPSAVMVDPDSQFFLLLEKFFHFRRRGRRHCRGDRDDARFYVLSHRERDPVEDRFGAV